jgi:nucleotide-binding universal stress UspA family protein
MSVDRILLPTAAKPLGNAKLKLVEQHARAFDAEVLVMHVLPPGHPAETGGSNAEASARDYLDTVVAGFRGAGVRAKPLLRHGSVVNVILEQAQQKDVQLIVLGASERGSVTTRLIGTIPDRVARGAACPVMIVR